MPSSLWIGNINENCPRHPKELVFELLTTLDMTKLTGCDGISLKMLKHTASSVALLLSKLINLSICAGNSPKNGNWLELVQFPKEQTGAHHLY